jgi:hypothetical protein
MYWRVWPLLLICKVIAFTAFGMGSLGILFQHPPRSRINRSLGRGVSLSRSLFVSTMGILPL